MTKKLKAHHARVIEQQALGIPEASGVARLATGSFLVVDDERGVFRYELGGSAESLDIGRDLVDLEGVCVSPDGATAWILSERDSSVWRYRVSDGGLDGAVRVGALPTLSSRKNQGWEGIAFAGPGVLAAEATLVAVHQKKPRVVGLFAPDSLTQRAVLSLPKRAKKLLGDLNDVTVHPKTGHLVVVSGKKGSLAELALEGGQLELRRAFYIDHAANDVPEGVTYDADDRLWVVTDGKGSLRQLGLGLRMDEGHS